MVESPFIAVLSILASLGGLMIVLTLYRSYQIDKFREKIFALREEIFLYSLDQELVDNTAHRNLRNLLNSLLRYAHKITFPHMVALIIAKRVLKVPLDMERSPMAEWEIAVEKLSDAQQQKFMHFNKRAMGLVVKHVTSRSIFFWVFAISVVVPRIVLGQISTSAGKIKGAVKSLVPVGLFEAEALRTSKFTP